MVVADTVSLANLILVLSEVHLENCWLLAGSLAMTITVALGIRAFHAQFAEAEQQIMV